MDSWHSRCGLFFSCCVSHSRSISSQLATASNERILSLVCSRNIQMLHWAKQRPENKLNTDHRSKWWGIKTISAAASDKNHEAICWSLIPPMWRAGGHLSNTPRHASIHNFSSSRENTPRWTVDILAAVSFSHVASRTVVAFRPNWPLHQTKGSCHWFAQETYKCFTGRSNDQKTNSTLTIVPSGEE